MCSHLRENLQQDFSFFPRHHFQPRRKIYENEMKVKKKAMKKIKQEEDAMVVVVFLEWNGPQFIQAYQSSFPLFSTIYRRVDKR